MAHKFDARHLEKLDNPQRRQALPPEEILLKLGLKPGDLFADIGCGIGYFSFPASVIVGPAGKVLAADTSEIMREEFKKRMINHPLRNLKFISSVEYDPGIPPGSCTFALMSNVLHEIDDKGRILSQVHQILKAGGKLAIIDWEKREMPHGPPLRHRLEPGEVGELLLDNGFSNIRTLQLHKDFYAVLAVKTGPH